MVEFLRDVFVVVALLATLIAVALHPGAEAEAHGETPAVQPPATAAEAAGMVAHHAGQRLPTAK